MSDQTIYHSVLEQNGSYASCVQSTGQNLNNKYQNSPFNPTSCYINSGTTPQEQKAFSPNINWAKVWQIGIGSGIGNPINWGSWKDKSVNGLVSVNPFVNLRTQNNPNAVFSMSQEFTDEISLDNLSNYSKTMSDTFGDIAKAKESAVGAMYTMQGFSGSNPLDVTRVTQRYQGVRGWNGPGNFDIDGNLTFTFNFGQAGLYSGMEEVVKPILALASLIAPHKIGPNLSTSLSVPTEYIMGSILGSLYQGFTDKVSNSSVAQLTDALSSCLASVREDFKTGYNENNGSLAMKVTSGASYAGLDMAVQLNTIMAKAQDATALKALSLSRLIYFKLGPLQLGPFYISDVTWSFDMSSTDSDGCPVQGSITFNKVESPYTPTLNNLLKMIDPNLLSRF